MTDFHIVVTGTKEVIAALQALKDRAPESLEGGLFEFGSLVEGDAKVLTPVRTGNLRASGYTITPTLESLSEMSDVDPESRALAVRSAEQITAVVGFGGPAQRYALIQHERTDFHHAVGQAKYLETAVTGRAQDMPDVLAARMRRDLARWVG